jgi:biopolymer transport protein ExbB
MNFLIRSLFYSPAIALFLNPMLAFAAEDGGKPLWIVSVFTRGGPVMYAIFACSVVSIAIAVERAVSLRRKNLINKVFLHEVKKLAVKGDFEKAISLCKTADGAMSRIMQAGLRRGKYGVIEVERAIESAGAHEAGALDANLRGLGFIATMAPMLGLLGTVTGMIASFEAISSIGANGPAVVAGGIAEALLNTVGGIIVAIHSLASYHFFKGKADKLTREMEELCIQFVEDIMYAVEAVRSKTGLAPKDDDAV